MALQEYKRKRSFMPRSNWPKIEAQTMNQRGSIDIDGCTIELFNVDRQIWKDVPKARLIQYYHDVSSYILPHLKDRPESLHLKPINAGAEGFYIKDMEGRQPDCANIFSDTRRHAAPGKRSKIDYLICNNEPTLLWMINLGCIDVNPWNSRTTNPGHPDYLAIDLDPTIKDPTHNNLDKLLDTALATKQYLDKKKLKAFCKTSGKTGIHFYLPCTGIDYPQARALTEQMCGEIHALVPQSSTVENAIAHRGELVYIDASQNDYADTLAAPYSVRPFHLPTVSTPLQWKEITRRLDPFEFTIDTIPARLKKKGDLFAGLLDKNVAAANMKILNRLFAEASRIS
jgi:bifunctional non-homologous end joining protein LigD